MDFSMIRASLLFSRALQSVAKVNVCKKLKANKSGTGERADDRKTNVGCVYLSTPGLALKVAGGRDMTMLRAARSARCKSASDELFAVNAAAAK
jgi:hypothetical protein